MLAWQVMRVFIKSLVKDGYRLPAIDALLLRGAGEPQTQDVMKAMMLSLAETYGLKMRTRKASA